jgi:hypothetical protein
MATMRSPEMAMASADGLLESMVTTSALTTRTISSPEVAVLLSAYTLQESAEISTAKSRILILTVFIFSSLYLAPISKPFLHHGPSVRPSFILVSQPMLHSDAN